MNQTKKNEKNKGYPSCECEAKAQKIQVEHRPSSY